MQDVTSIKIEKIRRFGAEEITLILFICATDLSTYDDEDVVSFTECIEGRVEVLLSETELVEFKDILKLDELAIQRLMALQKLLIKLYSSKWHKKLKLNTQERMDIRLLARDIIDYLKIEYVEPNLYLSAHLGID